MATTISAADLTVKIVETISLDGKSLGGTSSVTRTSSSAIRDIYRRIINVPSTETVLFTAAASGKAGGIVDTDDVKYMRITNKDASNGVDLIIQNSADDEIGYHLAAGESFVMWGFNAVLESAASAVTVVAGVAASASLSIADGDDATSGQFTQGEYVKFIALDGTVGIFILSDSSETGAVASGTVLTASSDLGDPSVGGGVPSSSLLAQGTCVAVTMNLNTCTQALLLNELRDTMGASTSPLLNKISGAAGTVPSSNGTQSLVFTQATPGLAGNTVTTTNISQLTAPDFTSGVDGAVSNKVQIKSINAIANTENVDVEVFIASKV